MASPPEHPRRTSIRAELTRTTLAPLLCAIVLLGLVSLLGARHLVHQHAHRIVEQTMAQAKARLDTIVRGILAHEAIVQEALRTVPLDDGPLRTTLVHLVDRFEDATDLTYLGFGLESNGAYYMLERRPDGVIRVSALWRDPDGTARLLEATHDDGRTSAFEEVPADEYDPRTRPHYLLAKEANAPVWTDSYPFWKGNERGEVPGVTYASPWRRDGRLVGVVDVDVEVEPLGRLLAGLTGEASATVFLLEDRSDGTTRVLATGNAGATEAIDALGAMAPHAHALDTCEVEGTRTSHLGAIAALDRPSGPPWRIGMVVSTASLAAPFMATLRWMAIVAVALMALAIWLSFRLSRRVSRPLATLSSRLRGGSSATEEEQFELAEAADVAEAYRTMADRMNVRQDGLERTNQALSVEVEQRRLAEEELRAREARLAALNRSLIDLAHNRRLLTADLQTALREAAVLGCAALDIERISVWFYDETRTSIRCVELYERTAARHSSGTVLSAVDHPDYFRALETDRLVVAHDARNDPRTRGFTVGYLDVLGITSLIDAAIRSGDRIIGIVCFEHVGPRRTWTTEDELFADGFADLLMVAIESSERRQAEARLRELNASLEQRVDERTRDLALANSRLSELDRLKSQFLATTSHELRTPLNSIIGFTSNVRSGRAGPVTDEQGRQLEIVHTSARHLLGLINDLLDLSRIESGRMSVTWERVRPAEVIDEATRSLAPLVAGKQLAWETHVESRDTAVETDRKKLLQVLLNLGANAVKFTERGTIRLDARVADDRYEVTVRDTGMGIRPEHMPLLFEPFGRLDADARRALEGTGLGLYLCKQLLGLLGGGIEAQSTLGEGSTFRFWIPVRRTPPADS